MTSSAVAKSTLSLMVLMMPSMEQGLDYLRSRYARLFAEDFDGHGIAVMTAWSMTVT